MVNVRGDTVRRILAYFDLKEGDFEEAVWENGGPIPYFDREAGWIEESGIYLQNSILIESEDPRDTTEAWDRYIAYLANFIDEHSWEDEGINPLTFDEYSGKSPLEGGKLKPSDTDEFVGQIIDVFEDFLADESEIAIAGQDYDVLSSAINEVIKKWGIKK